MYDYFTTISCTILRTIGGRGGYCCFENVVSFSLDRIQGIHLSLSDGCRKVRPLRYDETQERRGGVSATNPNVMFFPRWILAKRPIVRPRFPATIGNRTKNTGRADGLIDQRGPGWSPFLAATGGCRVEKSLSQNIVIYLYWIIN